VSIEKGVTRSDFGALEKPQRTAAGFLRADGYFTRAGIFRYMNPDGTVRRELRHPREVFDAESVKSFALAPVTDDHPPTNITADNAREYTRGSVSENLKQDGNLMRGSMLVTDAALIAKMERGDSGEVSCGYTCDVELEAGVWNGERYDAVQKNIRGNHVALVKHGRAGEGVRVRMDARDAVMISDPGGSALNQEQNEMAVTLKTIRFDGISYEGCTDQVAEVVEKIVAQRDTAVGQIATAKKDAADQAAKHEARADAAEAEVAKLKADALEAPKRIRTEIAARMGLEASARQLLGKSVKLDGLSDREVQAKVLTKLEPKLDLSAKGDQYVAARFDIAIEAAKTDSTEDLRKVRLANEEQHADADDADVVRLDVDAARERSAEEARNAWKAPIGRVIAKS
jgi:hypothetical protein